MCAPPPVCLILPPQSRADIPRSCAQLILNRFENIPFVMVNLVSLQETEIFLAKGYFGMVVFLILNISNNSRELRVAIRESPETFLPAETTGDPLLLIDEIG